MKITKHRKRYWKAYIEKLYASKVKPNEQNLVLIVKSSLQYNLFKVRIFYIDIYLFIYICHKDDRDNIFMMIYRIRLNISSL